jgi:hypothetical protein
LKSSWPPVLSTGLQRLNFATVLFSFKVEVDGESVEHKMSLGNLSNFHASLTAGPVGVAFHPKKRGRPC